MLQLESFHPEAAGRLLVQERMAFIGGKLFFLFFFFLFYSQLALTRLLLTAGCAVTCHRAMLRHKSRISHISKDPLSNISVYPISSHPIRFFPPAIGAGGGPQFRPVWRAFRPAYQFSVCCRAPSAPPSFSREHLCGGRRSSVSTPK